MSAVVVAGIAVAVFAPIVVVVLRLGGVLQPGPYYPEAWAWPTIFTVAFAATISLNALVWVRVIRVLDRDPVIRRRVSTILIAFILLAIGSYVTVWVLALLGIFIYFQIPVSY